ASRSEALIAAAKLHASLSVDSRIAAAPRDAIVQCKSTSQTGAGEVGPLEQRDSVGRPSSIPACQPAETRNDPMRTTAAKPAPATLASADVLPQAEEAIAAAEQLLQSAKAAIRNRVAD